MSASLSKKLGVAASAVLFTLVGGEIAARLMLGDSFRADVVTDLPMNACVTVDPELGWRNRADLRAEATGPTLQFPVFRYQVTMNSRGLRDSEHPLEKPEGVKRIVVLGDSFAWGWGVDDGFSFPDVLEKRLGPQVEVINLGVPGYSTDQELLWFEREGKLYEPDLVILCLLMNDIEGNGMTFRDNMGKPRLGATEGGFDFENLPVTNGPEPEAFADDGPFARLRRRFALLQLFSNQEPREVVRDEIDSAWSELSPEELRDLLLQQEWPFFDADKLARYPKELVDPSSATHELLRRLKESAEESGASLLAFSAAHYHDYYLTVPGKPESDAAIRAAQEGTAFQSDLSLHLEQAGRALGFATLSVDQAMLEAVRAGNMLNVGDGHLNELGNEIVAKELEAWVRENLDLAD